LLSEARVQSSSVVGRGHLKLALLVGEQVISAFGLDMGPRLPEPGRSITAVGALRPDAWAAGERVEMRLHDFE
jgi:hypothetical protein